MLTDQHLKEITKVLGEEQVQRVQAYSVWREQQRYSDEDLWARLYELYESEVAVLKQLPLVHRLGHSDRKDYLSWRARWLNMLLQLEADKPVKEAYAWHLIQRGDPYIAQWLEECEEYKRANTLAWQREAWGADDE